MASPTPPDKLATVVSEEKTSPSDDENERNRRDILSRFTAEDDKRIMRKVDWHFLPLMAIMYIIKQIDYTNAASVKVLQVGLPSNILTELSISSNQYTWTTTLYFIGMVLFEVPSNMLLKKITPRIWMTRIFLTWGIVVACHAAVQNKAGLFALRFLLGVLEAGFFPGLTTQMCSWYRSDEYGRPIVWMFAAQSISGIVGSLLVYGLSYMNGIRNLSAWRWVFLIEGLATILFSAVIYIFLPDYPKSARSARWLTPEEQEYLEVRLSENAPRSDEAAFKFSEIIDVLKDPRIISFTSCQLLLNVAGYGLSWETPTIVTSLGFASLPKNQLLLIPPAAATVICQVAVAWLLRKSYFVRPVYNLMICIATFVFFMVLCFPVSNGAVYAACTMGQALYYTYFISFWAWRSASLVGATGTAFALSAQTAVAQIGATIGPNVFQSRWAYNGYKQSFYICTACCAAAVVTTCITWYLTRNLEYDVWKVRRNRIESEKRGDVWTGDDVHVFENQVTFAQVSVPKSHAV